MSFQNAKERLLSNSLGLFFTEIWKWIDYSKLLAFHICKMLETTGSTEKWKRNGRQNALRKNEKKLWFSLLADTEKKIFDYFPCDNPTKRLVKRVSAKWRIMSWQRNQSRWFQRQTEHTSWSRHKHCFRCLYLIRRM